MTALSDMGGRTEHFGQIEREADEPVFHERWEARVFGMSGLIMARAGRNLDAARYAMERLPADVYMSSYYRRWLGGFERLLVERGDLEPGEVDARLAGASASPARRRGLTWAQLAVTSGVLRPLLRPTLPRWLCAHVLPRVLGGARPARAERASQSAIASACASRNPAGTPGSRAT